jgi:diguanylate cyclase (GGDEF)-like protein
MLTFVDMDGLKFINDNYGHNEGDFAIKKLAEAITESVRPGSVCARFGGDEFVIFNKNVSDKDAESFERKLNRKLENKNEIFNKPYKISASVGSIVTVANDDTTLFNLIQQADDAMYEIKKRKKNSRSFG